MANGSILTNSGKKIIINRAFKAAPDYTPVSQFKIGISNGTPNVADTDLDVAVPIENGTVCDNGDQVFTGSIGADNSQDTIITVKEGAGLSDGKAQSLMADAAGTNVLKTWTSPVLSGAGSNKTANLPFGAWLYISAAAYAKLVTAGTAVSMRFLTNADADITKNYQYNRTKAQLAAGWNWITSGTTLTNALTQGTGGAPGGVLDLFQINVTTVAAGDTFAADELVYDLLREWSVADLKNNFVSGYPTIDETNYEVQMRCALSSLVANGFDINGLGFVNTDGTVLFGSEDTFTAESKSSTDQFVFIITNRLI